MYNFYLNTSDKKWGQAYLNKKFFDIIIDDASHRSKDQITSFKYLFPYVNSGGLYVIEDLHVGYGNIGDYNKKGAYKTDKKNIIHFLKERVDDVNFHGTFRSNGYKRICKKNSSLNKYTFPFEKSELLHPIDFLNHLFKVDFCKSGIFLFVEKPKID